MGVRRLWFLLPDCNGGGAERAALRLAVELHRRGIEVGTIVRSASGPLTEEFRSAGPPFIDLGAASRRHHAELLPHRLRRSLRSAGVSETDTFVVFLSGIGSALALRLAGVRDIWISVQNPPSATPMGRLTGWFGRNTGVPVGFVAPTRGLARELDGSRSPRTKVVPNPVEPDLCPPAVRRPGHLVLAGRLAPQKRIDVALRAIAAGPTSVTLDILGEGDLRAELGSLAVRLGVDRRVRFCGFVDDASERIAQADALLLTSDYEGFGNVLVEALACGTPVISTDAPYGPGEIIGPVLDAGCHLCPPGDDEAIAAAIGAHVNGLTNVDRVALKARALDYRTDTVAQELLEAIGFAP